LIDFLISYALCIVQVRAPTLQCKSQFARAVMTIRSVNSTIYDRWFAVATALVTLNESETRIVEASMKMPGDNVEHLRRNAWI